MSEPVVIAAGHEDLPSLARLFDAYRGFYRQPPAPVQCASFLAARLAARDSAILLARTGDRDVGFTQLYPLWSSISMTRVWLLNDLYVLPEARRRGVARKLMDAARRLALVDGASAIRLSTELSNLGAQSLYERAGYQRDQTFAYYQLRLEPAPAEGRAGD